MSNKIDEIFCINLKIRKDRKIFIKRQIRKKNLPNIKFFNAIYDKDNGYKGCLLSHLEIIKYAAKKKLNNILIIEDDCLFLRKFNLPKFPDKYDMLYLGGNIANIYDENKPWTKASIWTTHSYIIHNSIFNYVIEHLEKYDKEIDHFYKNYVHVNKNTYILNPILTTQKEGYSNIQNNYTNYKYMNNFDDFKQIEFAKHEIINDNYILKLDDINDDDLPYVSILTPTYNRRKFFKLAINNFLSFSYPRNKLEWVIIDDGDEEIKDLLPLDENIKYIKLQTNKKLPISIKRNLCVKYAKHDFLLHMDDDDYYPSYSIISRIKILLQNKNKECVGCIKLGCLDIIKNISYTVTGDNFLSEASLAYTRNFFNKKPFNQNIINGEGKLFIQDRYDKCIQIPYPFILIALNHSDNITKDLRKTDINIQNNNIFNIDDKTMEIIKLIKI